LEGWSFTIKLCPHRNVEEHGAMIFSDLKTKFQTASGEGVESNLGEAFSFCIFPAAKIPAYEKAKRDDPPTSVSSVEPYVNKDGLNSMQCVVCSNVKEIENDS
jgi:hypothetical protein